MTAVTVQRPCFVTKVLRVASLIAVLVSLISSPLYAATPKGLTISPLRNEITLNPGTSSDGVLEVTNNTAQTLAVTLAADQFSVTDPAYDYSFSEGGDITHWVVFNPANLSIAPGKQATVKYRLSVPLGAEPGGRYLSLFASSTVSAQGGGIVTRQRVASLIYLTVNGRVSRTGIVRSLRSPLIMMSPTSWSAMIQDQGTTHFRSRYTVQMQTVFGQTIIQTQASSLILPGTIRLISGELLAPSLPGLYKIHYLIGLGDSPALQQTRWILYVPVWVMVTLAAGLVGVILVSIHRRTRR